MLVRGVCFMSHAMLLFSFVVGGADVVVIRDQYML